MNHFGRLFSVNIYGESHGGGVGVVVDGVKPGIKLSEEDFTYDLSRRKSGGLGTTPRIEDDEIIIDSGIFNGYTTGAPISLRFLNKNTRSKDYSNLVKHPRPSHADFTALCKYDGFNDYRGGGHFSGRITLGIVAAGVIAKKMLEGVKFTTKITNLGGETDSSKFQEVLRNTVMEKDSVGGIVSICVDGVKIGLGEPYFDSIESILSHLLFSVGGVKGVEFGTGFKGASMRGSEFNDPIIDENGKTKTNNNGGINGGISNGNPILINAFVKPTPSIGKTQETYNLINGKIEKLDIEGRHDAAIILRAQVVLESMVAIGLADLKLISDAYKK
ncbi:MAG: chorismate synthase [Acholeplasmatales bacterium]|nr:chorismate synthase [Acholeplasmatales bacterium]